MKSIVQDPSGFKTLFFNDRFIFTGIVLMALLIRLIYYFSVHNSFWVTNPMIDAFNYHHWALDILNGDVLGKGVFKHGPLYPFIIALIYKFSNPAPANVLLIQTLMGSITCGFMFLIGKKLGSRVIGIIAGLFEVFYGMALFYQGTLLSVTLIHFINLLLLLATYRAVTTSKTRDYLIIGILLGLAVLCRANIILYLPLLLFWLGWHWTKHVSRKIIISRMAFIILAFGLTLLPSLSRNMMVLDEPLLTVGNGGIAFYLGNYKDATGFHKPTGELGLDATNQTEGFKRTAEERLGRKLRFSQSSRYWSGLALRDISNDPGRWIALLMRKTLLFLNHYEFTTSLNSYIIRASVPFLQFPWLSFGLLLPLALLGIFFSIKNWQTYFPLYSFIAIYGFTNIALLVSSEYRYGIMPAVFIFSALGVLVLRDLVKSRKWDKILLSLALLGASYAVVFSPAYTKDDKGYHMATGYSNFGGLYTSLNLPGSAVEAFNIALKYQPGHEWLRIQLGEAYFKNRQYNEALRIYEELYPTNQTNLSLLAPFGNVLTAIGDYNKAITIRKQAIQAQPTIMTSYFNLGVTLMWAGKDEEATAAFQHVLQSDPSHEQSIFRTIESIKKQRR